MRLCIRGRTLRTRPRSGYSKTTLNCFLVHFLYAVCLQTLNGKILPEAGILTNTKADKNKAESDSSAHKDSGKKGSAAATVDSTAGGHSRNSTFETAAATGSNLRSSSDAQAGLEGADAGGSSDHGHGPSRSEENDAGRMVERAFEIAKELKKSSSASSVASSSSATAVDALAAVRESVNATVAVMEVTQEKIETLAHAADKASPRICHAL